jgi:hypothetical protein
MWIKRVIVLAMLFHLLGGQALADVVVLRDGKRHVGAVANREELRARPSVYSRISILLEESGELMRIDVNRVEYVILEDDGRKEVIDFYTASPSEEANPPEVHSEPIVLHSSAGTSTVLMMTGAAVASVGALIKFGEERVTISSQDVDYSDETYNALNYVMIVGGAALIMAGILVRTSEARYASFQARGAVLDFPVDKRGFGVKVGYSYSF